MSLSFRLGLALASLLALGASTAGCATFATHEEYAAYRQLRQTRDDNERLAALAGYAQRFPSGWWIEEVRTERTARETEVWAARNSTREGLEFYLSVYPDGQFVEQANQRMSALTLVGGRREEQQERVEEVQTQRREASAEERRQWVTSAVTFWARTLLGIRNYGQSISQVARANPEFSRAFGQSPPPLCTPQSCLKHYHSHYAIPVPGATRIERQMHVFLRILLDRGRVERVEVLLPNKGFSRWYELENRTLVTDEDPQQRQAAIEWVLQRLEPVIAQVAAGARPIDVVPAPIVPISAAAQAASATAEDSDSEVIGAEPPAAAPTPQPGATPQAAPQEGSIDSLLEQAIGGTGEAPAAEQAPQQVEPPPDTSTLVLPIGIRALSRGNTRIVIFAAGDEDYGDAYDGFYIERVRD
jgi:hypothetical protein